VIYLLICESNTISTLKRCKVGRAPASLKRWTLDNVITLTSDDSHNIGDDSRNSMNVSHTCVNHALCESSAKPQSVTHFSYCIVMCVQKN